jgi:hypothetical protein
MRRTSSVQLRTLVVGVALAVQALIAGAAGAQCFIQPLNSGQMFIVSANPQLFSFAPSGGHWGAIGIRSLPGQDWLLQIFGSSLPFPPCVTGSIITTSGPIPGRVNFVVGDFRVVTPQTYYARAFGGASPPGFIEYDATSGDLIVNDQMKTIPTGTNDVIHVWDAALDASQTYRIDFSATSGVNARVLIFQNPGGPGWQDRGSALIESATSFDFSPPATDSYAIVVVNDNGASGSYSISIGQCSAPINLVSGVAQSAPTGFGFYQFRVSGYPLWAAAAIRGAGAGASAYQLDVASGTGGTFPNCFTGNLATSNQVATNLVVGDFHYNPDGQYYAETRRITAATGGGPPTVDLDASPSTILVNGPPLTAPTDTGDVVQIWDVYLTKGQDVDFSLTHSGTATLEMLLFRPTGSALWLARSAAEFVTSNTATYTVPASGYYGLAVLNENGAPGSMTIQVNACHAPVLLANNVAVSTAPDQGEFYEFGGSTSFTWVAFGARAAVDWDVWEYDTGPVQGTPDCLYNMRAQSFDHEPTRVDYVITDFHKNPPGPFFARAFPADAGASARVECSAATHTILSGDPVSIGAVATGDVLQTWQAIVSSGQNYLIHFMPSGPGYRLAVFRSFIGDYWVSGSNAMFEVRHDTTIVAPANLTLGLVVLNDAGVAGGYELGLNPPAVAVTPSAIPSRTELLGVTPNPAAADSRIEFTLNQGAEVAFDVLDIAGRVVARTAPQRYAAGRWTQAWGQGMGNGAALNPGLYFVRMRVDGATSSAKRVSLIR